VALSIPAIMIGESFNAYGSKFFDFDTEYNAMENALYASLLRTVYVLPFCLFLVIKLTSGFGKYENSTDLGFGWKKRFTSLAPISQRVCRNFEYLHISIPFLQEVKFPGVHHLFVLY